MLARERSAALLWKSKQSVCLCGWLCGDKVSPICVHCSRYGFVHLSAGDLLRAERNSGSPDGDLIQSYIKDGRIVPVRVPCSSSPSSISTSHLPLCYAQVEITVNLIKKAMAASGAQLFLVDGFPRNFDNLQGWHKVMGDEVHCHQSVCIANLTLFPRPVSPRLRSSLSCSTTLMRHAWSSAS